MNYKPKPIATEKIALPPELLQLTEQLAENAHEVWGRQRLSDGWRFGPQRDDVQKTHPGLLPYAELSESEKEYDRQVAMETIKAIVALGYTIKADHK